MVNGEVNSEGGMTRRPTQEDVARLAGVSQTTVSMVLNNRGHLAVPEETRRRVLEAAEQLGYVPDTNARSLRTRKTYTIASIIPDITNPFYPEVERGLQDIADQHGYDLIVYNTDGLEEKERQCLLSVMQRRVDGVVASLFHLRVPDLRPLLERGVPVVRLESRPQETGPLPLDNLYVDSISAARDATSYLLDRGYWPLAIIASKTGPGPLRLQGYMTALAEHGLSVEEDLVVDADFTEHGGYLAAQTLLERRKPRAIFAANDLMAMGALLALRESGLRVPNDVAVMGFDDIPAAKLVQPPLTTVRLHQKHLGRRAAEMLFERLAGKAPSWGRSEAMPFEVITRDSA